MLLLAPIAAFASLDKGFGVRIVVVDVLDVELDVDLGAELGTRVKLLLNGVAELLENLSMEITPLFAGLLSLESMSLELFSVNWNSFPKNLGGT